MISNEIQEELYENLVENDDPLNQGCSKYHDWYNPEASDGRSLTRKFRIPDYSEDEMVNEIANYVAFLEHRSGDDFFVRMLIKWFTTEDLLFYQIAYDENETWMLSYEPMGKHIRVKTRPGKFYRRFQSDRHQVVDGDAIVELARQFAEDWAGAVEHSQDKHLEYDVTVYKTPRGIEDEYRAYHGTRLNSCMSHPNSEFSTGGIHPTTCYGSDSQIHLATVYRIETGERIARTLLYNGKWVRLYPANDTMTKRLAAAVLKLRGIATGQRDLLGARLNYVAHGEESDLIVCPYVDGMSGCVKPVYPEGMPDGKPLYLLVTDEDRTIDTQSSDFYRHACFDPNNMCAYSTEYDYECRHCDNRFNSHSEQIEADDHMFCDSNCAENAGYNYAYLSEDGYMEWTSDPVWHWDGNYYTEDALEYRDLCIIDSGEVYKRDECTQTERGYYVNDDLVFINSVEEFNKIARDNPRILAMVWVHPDDNEGFFLFRNSQDGAMPNDTHVGYLKEYYAEDNLKDNFEALLAVRDSQPF